MFSLIAISPPCPACGDDVRMASRVRHFRRGTRVIVVESLAWKCETCKTAPFVDEALMALEDERAQEVWLTKYGEDMPPSAQGHRVSEGRTVRVPILLTREEVVRLDAARGPLSRGEYLRQPLTVGSPS